MKKILSTTKNNSTRQTLSFGGFWRLFRLYLKSEEKLRAWALLGVVIGLNFAAVYLLVRINTWYNEFYNALQNYEEQLFWPLVGEFTALAFIYIIIAVYAIYLRQMLQIKWRTWMTRQYVDNWLNNQVYRRMQIGAYGDTDNPDQRISEDINQFVSLSLALLIGFLKQLTTLAAFGVVLWNLSGVFTVPIGQTEFVIYGYMFWFSLIYSTAGTFLAHLVGRKLIGLNYDQQRYEADFRFGMMRLRENSESIAFYRGEKAEKAGFAERFAAVIANFWQLMRQTKLLNFYVNGYAQLAVIVPLIMAAPQYFSGAMALGGLMQTISAFGRVQDALSYFVESYDTIAQLASVVARLDGFTAHMNEAAEVKSAVTFSVDDETFSVTAVTVGLPRDKNGTEKFLLGDCSLALNSGQHLLVTGASGSGKSTFLRTLAGIWPYAEGSVGLPATKGGSSLIPVMFLPQKPYLPLGTLKRALCYPLTEETFADDVLRAILNETALPHLRERLGDAEDWSRILSLGEQQRLAFARILLAKPRCVFLDEATSALDETREKEMYELLFARLPQTIVVSVGHRGTLFALHDKELRFTGDGKWELHPITVANNEAPNE